VPKRIRDPNHKVARARKPRGRAGHESSPRAEELNSAEHDHLAGHHTVAELYDSAPIGYIVFGDDGMIHEVNGRAAELVGLEPSHLIGLPFPVIVAPDDILLFFEHLSRCRAGQERMIRTELRLRSQPMDLIPCELVSAATREGNRTAFRTALIDLSDRKEHEQALQESKDYAEGVFEFVPEPLMVLDGKLMVLTTNSAFREKLFCSTRETTGHLVDQLECVRWGPAGFITALRGVATQGRSFEKIPCEATLLGLGRKVFLLASARRMARPGALKPAVVVAFEDVTERRHHESEREQLLAEVQALNAELEKRVAIRTAELNEANLRLRAASRRIVEAQEAERRNLARELHDEVGQCLTGLNMVLARGARGAKKKESRQAFANAQRVVVDLLQRVRQMSVDLRPHVLDNLGLVPALKWHIQTYSRQTKIKVDLRTRGVNDNKVSPRTKLTIFRVVQEALTNVARHAHVRSAHVMLKSTPDELLAEVSDRGVGFEVDSVSGEGSGLANMRERVLLSGGKFNLASKPHHGTTLKIRLPLRD
jgi:PAS domain S-box-containing protein